MRLFVGLDLDRAIRERMSRFVDGVREWAPDVRWVKPESYHITLKFIGHVDDARVDEIRRALEGVRSPQTRIALPGVGFFPSPRSARVFWVKVEADEHLEPLARRVEEALVPAGVEKEDRRFTPHITLARRGSGKPQRERGDRPNPLFARLQEKLASRAAPDFGTMTAREFFLYESQLSPQGARYRKIGSFALEERDAHG